MNRKVLYHTTIFVVMFLAGMVFGGNFVFSQTPSKVVVNINGDPKYNMGFNWVTSSSTIGKVEIVQGTDKTHADFSAPKLVDAHAPFLHNDTYVHKAEAGDLSPNTTYSYRVGNGTDWSAIGTFTTARDDKSGFSFLYTTDPQSEQVSDFTIAQTTIREAFKQLPEVKFWMTCGDYTNLNSTTEWDQYFTTLQNNHDRLPCAPVIGNHDWYYGVNLSNFQNYFNTKRVEIKGGRNALEGSVFSFVYGDALFLALHFEDYNEEYLNSLANWMRAEVANHSDTRWRIAFFHKAIYTGSFHRPDADAQIVRNAIAPVFDELNIDLAIQGHDHVYEVIGPVYDKQLVPDAAYGQKNETVHNVLNATGKSGGYYNTSKGTLYFMNSASGAKRYNPVLPLETIPTYGVPDYRSLFTGRFAQPGNPTYSNVHVATDEITISTYTVSAGSSALFDEIKLVKTPLTIPGNNVDLSSLTVSVGTLMPSFSADITTYVVNVPNNETSINLTATPENSDAQVSGAGAKTLHVGINIFTITVTDGSVKKTYTVAVNRAQPPSNNANLSNLIVIGNSVDELSLTPSFSFNEYSYNITVPYTVHSITVLATSEDYKAIVTGTVSNHLLTVGDNPVSVTVTAEDGTVKTYTVVVVRQSSSLSNDASLKSIQVDQQSATRKTGDPAVWEIEVDFTQSITVTATANHQTAIILEGNGVKMVQQALNIFEIVVKAEDGSTQKHYLHITVKGVLSKDELMVSQPLTAYSNPASEQITISGLEGYGTLTVFDVAGRQYIQCNITSSQETVYVNSLPKGTYIVQIVEGKNVRTIKIIVNNFQ